MTQTAEVNVPTVSFKLNVHVKICCGRNIYQFQIDYFQRRLDQWQNFKTVSLINEVLRK